MIAEARAEKSESRIRPDDVCHLARIGGRLPLCGARARSHHPGVRCTWDGESEHCGVCARPACPACLAILNAG